MGSLFSAKQPAPPTPAPPSTMRDEVNGVEQVPVTNPDGSITYITRTLPLTAEQQAQKDELDSIMKDSLDQIQALSATTYTNDAATQKVLDDWSAVQGKLLQQQVDTRTSAEEQALARRGLSDSSAADAVRRQRLLDAQSAEKNLTLAKDEMGNQIRADRLALQQNLYNLAANTKDASAARLQQAATRAQSEVTAVNTQRQASLLDYYNRGTSGGGVFGTALASGLGGSLGKTLGGAGTIVGGLLGSLFGR